MKSARLVFWFALAVMAFFAMAASSPQCARTSDLSVNPGLDPLAGNPCVTDCIAVYIQAKADEKGRFKAALAACNGDEECQAEQVALNIAIKAELEVDKDACIAACTHQQGAGTSGQ